MSACIHTAFEAIYGLWCAWDDRLGEDTSPYGWGATEAEAIAELEQQMEDAA